MSWPEAKTFDSKAGGWSDKTVSPVQVNGSKDRSVTVESRQTAERLGVDGVVVKLTATDKTDKSGKVKIDYSQFADAGGAGFGSRLRLVQLPECALTTPDEVKCQVQTLVTDSSNDAVGKIVSGSVPVGSVVVLALAASAGGSQGSFTASPLGPGGSWSAGGSSGVFSWSYPVKTAPTPTGGPAPQISVGYNSAWMDGRVAGSNNQGSWIGQGWDYSPGFIERTYRACADDPAGTSGTSYDLCWAGEILTFSLNGTTSEIVKDDATGTFKLRGDEGSRVERFTGSGSDDNDGEHWKITTTDGTQFWFGRFKAPGSTAVTASTWVVPVFGAHTGDPCHGSTFAASRCYQAWRWNLDYVEDAHGNAMSITYAKEISYYGVNKGATRVAYNQGGNPATITYGLRNINGNVTSTPGTHRVTFGLMERCENTTSFTCSDTTFTAANGAKWPDTPVDQFCKSSGTCTVYAPTFWSRKRLQTVTNSFWDGSVWKTLDTWVFKSYFPTGGEPTLWLEGITHTGYDTAGVAATMPVIRFYGQLLANRVQGFNSMPGMLFWRLIRVDDTGQSTNITYSAADCTASNVPTDPASNTKRCFPVKWTYPFQQSLTLDWFHKYVVTKVQVSDNAGLSKPHETNYTYVGSPAWHADDNEIVKPAARSYGQWRGYRTVETRGGDGQTGGNGQVDPTTLSKTTFFTGMGGVFTNSLGESVTDSDEFTGGVHETQTFSGDGGSVLSKSVTNYTVVATTATRSRTGLSALKATIALPTKSRSVRIVDGQTQTVTTNTVYDTQGRPVQEARTATGIDPICTRTTWAANTTRNISAVATQITSAQACPATGQAQTSVVSESRNYFDQSTATGTVPGVGDLTRVEQRIDSNRFAKSTATFDVMGRPTSTTVFTSDSDTTGRTTSVTYATGAGGQLASTTTTNPLGQTATTYAMPGRGFVTKHVDAAGAVVEATFDGLARVTSVWGPGQTKGTDQATKTYTYTIRTSGGPQAVTTKTLIDSGTVKTYRTTVELFDALGQKLQTQVESEQGNRLVADWIYDSNGNTVKANNRWATTGTPSTTLLTVNELNVDDRDIVFYDGAGRVTTNEKWKQGTKTWQTSYAYSGDRTTVIGPAGSTPTTTVTNVLGATTQVRHYTTPPTMSGNTVTGGTHQTTSYSYDAQGRQTGFTAIDGTQYGTSYDMAGRVVSSTDPDTGTQTETYNDVGEVLSVTDARGAAFTVHFEYDLLGRVTSKKVGTDKKQLATFVYDTVKTGQLTSQTSFQPAGSTNAYTSAVTAYDMLGNPTSTKTTIPTIEGALAGEYDFGATYTSTGLQKTVTQPAIGGLPAETLTTTYSKFGNPLTLKGANDYVVGSSYTDADELTQIVLKQNSTASINWWRDDQTRRITETVLSTQDLSSPTKTRLNYSHDPSGNITKKVETRGAISNYQRTTCYQYGNHQQLTSAWTATNNCTTTPSTTDHSMVGGPDAYWTTWTFNTAGNRTSQIKHVNPTGDPETTTNTYTTTGHTHALTSAITTNNTTNTQTTTTNSYDAHGNTTQTTTGTTTTSYTWNHNNQAATVTTPTGTTNYIYDTNNTQLIRKTIDKTVLYLPADNELTLTIGTGAMQGTRTYSHAGTLTATRTGNNTPVITFTDLQNTPITTMPWASYTPTHRTFDPYGNTQDPTPATWTTNRTFLNKPATPNNTIDMGARTYNPTTGGFLTPDPQLAQDDPLSPASYTYSNNNPATFSDPTGLRLTEDPRDIPAWNAWVNGRNQGLTATQTNAAVNKAHDYVYSHRKHKPRGIGKVPPPVAQGYCVGVMNGCQSIIPADPAYHEARVKGFGTGVLKGVASVALNPFLALLIVSWIDEEARKDPAYGTRGYGEGDLTGQGLAAAAAIPIGGAVGGATQATKAAQLATRAPGVASRMERTGSALTKSDAFHRVVSWVVDNPAAQRFRIGGDDGVARDLYQLSGEVNGKSGVFEWIIDRSGRNPVITHQRFIPGAGITGHANQVIVR